ncbi:MAG: hypothetical protein WCP16_24920, partial [Pseudanabaena sp. ELA645]
CAQSADFSGSLTDSHGSLPLKMSSSLLGGISMKLESLPPMETRLELTLCSTPSRLNSVIFCFA